jgi:hypothetical protein
LESHSGFPEEYEEIFEKEEHLSITNYLLKTEPKKEQSTPVLIKDSSTSINLKTDSSESNNINSSNKNLKHTTEVQQDDPSTLEDSLESKSDHISNPQIEKTRTTGFTFFFYLKNLFLIFYFNFLFFFI